jgi:hypothetical protein
LFGAREVKKLLALSLLFGSALIVFYFAPTPPSRGQNEARRQTADVAHPFRHNGELQAFAKAYVKFHEIRAEYEPKWTVAKTTREKGKVDEEAVAKFGEEIWIPACAG